MYIYIYMYAYIYIYMQIYIHIEISRAYGQRPFKDITGCKIQGSGFGCATPSPQTFAGNLGPKP